MKRIVASAAALLAVLWTHIEADQVVGFWSGSSLVALNIEVVDAESGEPVRAARLWIQVGLEMDEAEERRRDAEMVPEQRRVEYRMREELVGSRVMTGPDGKVTVYGWFDTRGSTEAVGEKIVRKGTLTPKARIRVKESATYCASDAELRDLIPVKTYEHDEREIDVSIRIDRRKKEPNQALQTTPMTRSVYEKTIEFGGPQRGV